MTHEKTLCGLPDKQKWLKNIIYHRLKRDKKTGRSQKNNFLLVKSPESIRVRAFSQKKVCYKSIITKKVELEKVK